MSEKAILVVVAHPDDEVLGCGGTIARHAEAGDLIDVLILAEGATSRKAQDDPSQRESEIKALRDSAQQAAEILGTRPPRFGSLPDNRLDTIPLLDVVKLVEAVVEEVAPSIVYTHHRGDLNIDHRIAHDAVITACRPLPEATTRAIYTFETVSSTEWGSPQQHRSFQPTRLVNIASTLERKMEALRRYESEMRDFPHARSYQAVEALARWRGAAIGLAAAEAFQVFRERVD